MVVQDVQNCPLGNNLVNFMGRCPERQTIENPITCAQLPFEYNYRIFIVGKTIDIIS